MKKTLSILLALVLILALCACGDKTPQPAPASPPPASGNTPSNQTDNSQPAAPAPAPANPAQPAPASPDKVYTFSFSVADPKGSLEDQYFVIPFQNLLDEKTGGRVKLDVYYGSTLAGQGTTLDAIRNGVCDMGQDVCAMYPGQFLYNELLGTPGFDFGGYENFSRVANEFSDVFYDKAMDSFVLIARFAFGDFGICTTKAPVYTPADMKGLMVRTSSQVIPWYEAMGASATFLPMSDVYESLRLSVINGVHTSVGSLYAFKLAEVSNYYTSLPMHCGDSVFVMSRDLYDTLPADLQAALDEVFAQMLDIGLNFAAETQQITMDTSLDMNPNFQFIEPTDVDGFVQAALPLVMAKVAELNAAGLDGDGAYNWLMAHTVN